MLTEFTHASVSTQLAIPRIPRHLPQGSWAVVKLHRPCPVEQGWVGRARLQGPRCSLCGVVTGRGGRSSQEAQGTQATPESEAGQKGRLPRAREACSRQVTQPVSSPEKCVSETPPRSTDSSENHPQSE